MKDLNELLEDDLKDIYDAEKQLVKALPKMAKAAENENLKAAFEDHLKQTQEHVKRLEQVFKALGLPAKGKKCAAMEGLVEEGAERIEDEAGDPALIGAAQRVEHYEMAAYGTVRAWAEALGHSDAASLLKQTFDEEAEADELLTEIAAEVNALAASAVDEDQKAA